MTKQQFIDAFWNEIKDIERRKKINSANQGVTGKPTANGAEAVAVTAATGADNAKILDDWWELISSAPAPAPGANSMRTGRLGAATAAGTQAFPAGYIPGADFTAVADNTTYPPNSGWNNGWVKSQANRQGINGNAAENWRQAFRNPAAGTAAEFDAEIAGWFFGKIYNAGWEAGDVTIDRNNNIILISPTNNIVIGGRGIANLISDGGIVDHLTAAPNCPGNWYDEFLKVAPNTEKEVIREWNNVRFGGFSNVATDTALSEAHRNQWLTAAEAAQLHKKGWKPADIGNDGTRLTIRASALGTAGPYKEGKNNVLNVKNKEQAWVDEFNRVLVALNGTQVDAKTAKVWYDLRDAKDESGNVDLRDDEKITVQVAANLHYHRWSPYVFQNWDGALQFRGGLNPITPANALDSLAQIGAQCQNVDIRAEWRRNFADRFVNAGGKATDMDRTGANSAHNKIMDAWFDLFKLEGVENGKSMHAGTTAAHFLNVDSAARAQFKGWKPEMIRRGDGLHPAPAANAVPVGGLAAISPADGKTIIRGENLFNGVNSWKKYYRDGFEGEEGNAAHESHEEIDKWADKIPIGKRAGAAFNNDWRLSDVNSSGKVTFNGRTFDAWRYSKGEAEKWKNEPEKDEKTPGSKTPEEIAEENKVKKNKEAAQKALNDIVKGIDITKLDTVEKINKTLDELNEFGKNTTHYGGQAPTVFKEDKKTQDLIKELETKKTELSGDKGPGDKGPGDGKSELETARNNAHREIEEEAKRKGIKDKDMPKILAGILESEFNIKTSKDDMKNLTIISALQKLAKPADVTKFTNAVKNSMEKTSQGSRWYKNPWVWTGIIVVVVAVAAAIWYFFMRKPNKPEEGEEEE